MPRISRSTVLAGLLCIGASCLLLPTVLLARTYTIGLTADDATVNGNCTLREAIRAAKTNAQVDACLAGEATDFIFLPPGTYPFGGSEFVAAGGSLSILGQTLNPFDVTIDLGNSGRFLELQGSGPYTLGGLEIANGKVTGTAENGGAISAAYVQLRMYSFRFVSNDSESGAGALNYYANQADQSLVLEHGSFLSNAVSGPPLGPSEGGAMKVNVTVGAWADLRDLAFVGNSVLESELSANGGALALLSGGSSASSIRCVRCLFQGNSVTATDPSSASQAGGGAVSADAHNGAQITIVDSSFTGNSAINSSSGIAASVLRAACTDGGSVELERLFIDFNGGANTPQTFDVAFRSFGTTSTFSFLDSQVTFGAGSGLSVDSEGDSTLGHLTIADYPLVGADLATVGIPLPKGEVLLQNSIVALNGTNIVVSGAVVGTTNSIGGDPVFVSAGTGDYHLNDLSPLIGAGTNDAATLRFADLDHHGRIAGGTTDIGCYEHDGLFADDFEVGDAGSWTSIAP